MAFAQQHILVVDDHEEIRELLGAFLRQHGYRVSAVDGGEAMFASMQKDRIDLVILDVMMPDEDGLTLLQRIRARQGPPVILLTALSEDVDSVVGLELGAEDYVTKPFSPRVLLARIKTVLRRGPPRFDPQTASTDPEEFRFGPWVFRPTQRLLSRNDGVLVPLSQSEYALLQVLLHHPNKVLERDQLLSLTKGRNALPFDRSVDNLVSRLRKKIEPDPSNPTFIQTVWGSGYQFQLIEEA